MLSKKNVTIRCVPKSKKGNAMLMMVLLAGLGIGAGFGISALMDKDSSDEGQKKLSVVEDENGKQIVVDEATNEATKLNNCGTDKTTSFDAVVINPLDDDGTATYHAVTLKVKGENSNALKSYTTDSDGTFASSSLSLNCGEDYKIYAPASQNSSSSLMIDFEADSPNDDRLLEVEQFDHISVTAYDNKNKGFVYDDSDATATDAEEILSSSGVTFKSTTNNATAYAMSTGGSLDWEFRLKTGTSQRSWGDLKNYAVIDADTSDYIKPTFSFNGKSLTVVKLAESGIGTEDQGYISGYEYAVLLPEDITEVEKVMKLQVGAKSGQDPDSDVIVRFVSESYYVDGTSVKRGIFDAGGNEILASPAQKITIDIS